MSLTFLALIYVGVLVLLSMCLRAANPLLTNLVKFVFHPAYRTVAIAYAWRINMGLEENPAFNFLTLSVLALQCGRHSHLE